MLIAAVLARCTLKPACISPSTNQYQLKVDSTTMPTNASLNAINATTMRANSLGRRFSNITRSCSSITDTTLLLECRSMPAYRFTSASSFEVVRHHYSTHDSTLRLRSRLDDYQAYTLGHHDDPAQATHPEL